jgi:hypothetical protein
LVRAVRELRQRKAYYRCCIPALAGFVSLRSIAPDGIVPLDQNGSRGKLKRKYGMRIAEWDQVPTTRVRSFWLARELSNCSADQFRNPRFAIRIFCYLIFLSIGR